MTLPIVYTQVVRTPPKNGKRRREEALLSSTEKQKEPERPAKRKRNYDLVAAKNKVLEKIQTDLTQGGRSQLKKSIEECCQALKDLQAQYDDPQEAKFFDGYVAIVKSRQQLAEAVLIDAGDGPDALASLVTEQVQQSPFQRRTRRWCRPSTMPRKSSGIGLTRLRQRMTSR